MINGLFIHILAASAFGSHLMKRRHFSFADQIGITLIEADDEDVFDS